MKLALLPDLARRRVPRRRDAEAGVACPRNEVDLGLEVQGEHPSRELPRPHGDVALVIQAHSPQPKVSVHRLQHEGQGRKGLVVFVKGDVCPVDHLAALVSQFEHIRRGELACKPIQELV